MIDNFDLILPLLNFENKQEFYFLQILQRKKDFEPGQQRLGRNNNNRLIKPYFVYNREQLEEYKPEIIKLCEVFNARAGINLNKRNQYDVAVKCLEILAIAMRKNDEFQGVSKIYSSACGKENSGDSYWVCDLDKDDLIDLERIKTKIESCRPLNKTKILAEIPSKSGIHLITTRFDRQTFKQEYPHLELHTNNPTNLYIP